MKKSLRIAQFNVENLFIYLDLYKGEELSSMSEDEWQSLSYASTSNKPLKKTLLLAESIKDLNADILMLNEVGGIESLTNFNKYFLNDSYTPYLIEGNSDRGIDVGYLVKKTLPFKYVHLSHKNRPINFLYPHELSENPKKASHRFSRDISELRVFEQDDNSPCMVFLLVHLKSKLDPDNIDFKGTRRREAELRTLVEVYNEVNSELNKNVPIFVAGDFNGHAAPYDTDEEFKDIYEKSDLEDSFTVEDNSKEEIYTQVQVNPTPPHDKTRIDYIFTSPKAKQLIQSAGIYRFKDEYDMPLPPPTTMSEKSELPSDHYPIYIDI